MDAEVSTLSAATLSILPTDQSNSMEAKEPTLNGLLHKGQITEQAETCISKTCDSSADTSSILTFREESASSAINKIDEEKVIALSDEKYLPSEMLEETYQGAKKLSEVEEENAESLKKDDDLAEEDGDDDDEADDDTSIPLKSERPRRDVPRRSVFEMLQSEINEDDDEYDEHDMAGDDNENDEDVMDNGKSKGRKKGRTKENDPELNLDGLNDDDDDEDFRADSLQKKSLTKKKVLPAKKEEKTLVLFDDDDLPLKGKRSGGRPKKKKTDDEEVPSEDDWHLIKGKLFQDEDDDHENDIDDYAYRQQALSEKKVLTSSNKRSYDGSTKSSKKIKIDVQGWKFSKPRDGMESKQKSKLSSGSANLLQASSGHHGSGNSSTVSASRHPSDDGRVGSRGLQDDDLRRKQSIMTLWEQKLRHLDRELEERVANVQRNEGKILREERRLRELETLLTYREKLLSSHEEFVSSGIEDAVERMSCLKSEYEKYRRLAEEHRDWIEKEHHRIEAHALGKSFEEDEDSTCQNKMVTSNLPSQEQYFQDEVTVIPLLLEKVEEATAEPKIADIPKNLKEVKVDG